MKFHLLTKGMILIQTFNVGRNSSNIANAASNLTVATQGAGFTLVFSGDATTGWTYKEK